MCSDILHLMFEASFVGDISRLGKVEVGDHNQTDSSPFPGFVCVKMKTIYCLWLPWSE